MRDEEPRPGEVAVTVIGPGCVVLCSINKSRGEGEGEVSTHRGEGGRGEKEGKGKGGYLNDDTSEAIEGIARGALVRGMV